MEAVTDSLGRDMSTERAKRGRACVYEGTPDGWKHFNSIGKLRVKLALCLGEEYWDFYSTDHKKMLRQTEGIPMDEAARIFRLSKKELIAWFIARRLTQ